MMRIEQLESYYLRLSSHEGRGKRLPLLKKRASRLIKEKLTEEVRKPLYGKRTPTS